MSRFFIDTATGQVATIRQLIDAGLGTADRLPERPWHRIQGSDDASMLWYAVLRKQVRGVHIGALAIRHLGHHASLLNDGWEEVGVHQIGVPDGWRAPIAATPTSTTRR
jgi:hypothetical protein